ncbi:hypothetical protein ARMGADRAFT_333022 [Armillaria gallica]|uniref:Uncharacterized protein n=1 Tax=Armillaria gallica TaxID=47427 RepID=A0A2H3DCN3_ARMGA|nr:hypothetical protein ARMGADRAFT_333022 [Armillaria gallica]
MIWLLWSLWLVFGDSLVDYLWIFLIVCSTIQRRKHGVNHTITVPRRGCQHYSGCYDRPDIHGHANDTAVLAQPHFTRADTGLETKGEVSECGGSAEGVYVFCG